MNKIPMNHSRTHPPTPSLNQDGFRTHPPTPSLNQREGGISRALLPRIQGQLTNAVAGGGNKALWNIARGRGPAAEKAREVIELSTSPFHNIDLYQAINIICKTMN